MGRALLLISALLLCLAACQRREPVLFEGIKFKTRVDTQRADRRDFTASVRGASRNIEAARQAGRFAGTVYCLDKFGGSEIEWSAAAEAAADQLTPAADDTLTFQGRCLAR